jgi:hypothetical protein
MWTYLYGFIRIVVYMKLYLLRRLISMVYVISNSGKALMPTKRHGKVRILLKQGKAKVVSNKPFTIKLLYDTKEYTQPISLGIDSGYTYIGFSAVTNDKELISGEVTLLSGQSERLKERTMYRRQRRSRLRYRKPRFDNRAKPKGWLAPSMQHKLDSHISFIDKLKKLLPITNIIVEVANFDIQKIKDPTISGVGYQEGEQKAFWNLREYILHRDNHTCQNPNCSNKSNDKILEVHHIGFWKKDRTDRPGNLITLCTKCHVPSNHKKDNILYGWEPKLKSFKEATFMTTIRWRVVNSLDCKHTYGFATKSKRIALDLEKSHYNDAFVVAGGSSQKRIEPIYYTQVKRNNRSLEKFYDAKYIDTRTGKKVSGQELFCGRRTRNTNLNTENLRKYRGEKASCGRRSIRTKRYFYQPNDLVRYDNKVYTVKGTHCKGTRVVLKESGKSIKVGGLFPYMFRSGFVAM